MTRVPAVSLHQVTRYPSDNINTQLNIPDPPIRLHTRPAYGEEIDLAFDLMLSIHCTSARPFGLLLQPPVCRVIWSADFI